MYGGAPLLVRQYSAAGCALIFVKKMTIYLELQEHTPSQSLRNFNSYPRSKNREHKKTRPLAGFFSNGL
jgi:hypothetical protein